MKVFPAPTPAPAGSSPSASPPPASWNGSHRVWSVRRMLGAVINAGGAFALLWWAC
ncbi:MAG: hypothetical protein Q4D19_00620 [Lautropia sp.]|nr:hypothetical protein [Lautropia sp.]